MSRAKTDIRRNLLTSEEATELYNELKNNIKWEDGIRSKKGFTRKAKALSTDELLTDHKKIHRYIFRALELFDKSYTIDGIYLNFYENGEMYTPSHRHPDTHQLIISLGATRTLKVGNKDYKMDNGSCILFGSSAHGVRKEPKVTDGRISIAVFMTRLKILDCFPLNL